MKNIATKFLFVLACFVVLSPQVFAISDDQKKVLGSGAHYFNVVSCSADTSTATASSGAGCCSASGDNFGPGTLPSSVPEPYNKIISAAANKADIPAALLAGIFYEENGGNFPDPPPPYGHGSAWPVSSANAQGPFQFEPGTWQQYGLDGNGDGKKDINDLTDAAFGAANYLAASGAKGKSDVASLTKAIFAYNHAQFYVNAVLGYFNKFGGASSSSGGGSTGSPGNPASSGACGDNSVSGAFTNPFPGGWEPNRLDMGYDGTFKGQIVAPFAGTITYSGIFTGWRGSYGIILRSAPDVGLPTHSLYFTEGIKPLVQSGQTVQAGTPIASPVSNPYNGVVGNIEWGVNQDGPVDKQVDTQALALGNSCASGSPSQQMVLDFAKWFEQKLHVAPPSSTDHAGCA
jgi:hypothetical protein